MQLFATDAALARARESERAAQARLTRVRADLSSLRSRLAVARTNERAAQRALALRLNEIYRARPLDALAVLLESRSWSDVSAGLDLLDRLSRSDSSLVALGPPLACQPCVCSRARSAAAEARARSEEATWQARVAALQQADRAHRALLTRLRSEHVRAVASPGLHRPPRRGAGQPRRTPAAARRRRSDTGASPPPPLPPAPRPPSLAAGSTLSVSSTAYSLPGHTASGLPVGPGICATDPRVIPLGTRFEVPGYGPCVAADTGSSVIGATIDLWMPDRAGVRVRDPDHYHHVSMMRRLRTLVLALGLLAIGVPVSSAAAHQAAQDAALARGIAKALAAHGFSGQGTGIAVADLATGEVIYQRNGARPLLPASTEKLFTTVGALSTLRPDFRFATTVVGVGARAGATWNGDLYLVGSGDPTFSSYDIDALAAQIKARGIPRISGRIRGDETVFDASRWGPWPARYIGVESPPLSGLALDRDTTTNGRDVASPSHSAARALRRALARAGVQVGVRFVAGGRAPKGALVLARVQSEPLWQIVRFMDRHSDNFTAEMVAKAIGAYAGGSGTTARGMHVAGEVAAPMLGEDASLVHLADGSGLSHANRTTAGALARLLAGAAANPAIAKPLAGALSVMGANGTLAHRLPELRGRVLGKSGTLDNVSALAGYVTARSGRRFSFAVLMNVPALSDWDAHATQDAIVRLLAKR